MFHCAYIISIDRLLADYARYNSGNGVAQEHHYSMYKRNAHGIYIFLVNIQTQKSIEALLYGNCNRITRVEIYMYMCVGTYMQITKYIYPNISTYK